MKLFLKFLLLLFLISIGTYCTGKIEALKPPKVTVDEIQVAHARIWLDSLCSQSFQGRKAGTEGARKAYAYLTGLITDMGYEYDNQFIETEKGSIIRTIIVTIPGQTDSTVIIGAHYDGATESNSEYHYPAANDNASGTVTLLLFLRNLSDSRIEGNKTMLVCFWGCEEVFDGRAFRASLHYARTMPEDLKAKVLLYINVDTMGHQNDMHKMLMEYPLNNRVISFAEGFITSRAFDYVKKVRTENLYSDFYSFNAVGIPFINFHDYCVPECEHPVHSLRDTPAFISVPQLNDMTYDIARIVNTY